MKVTSFFEHNLFSKNNTKICATTHLFSSDHFKESTKTRIPYWKAVKILVYPPTLGKAKYSFCCKSRGESRR